MAATQALRVNSPAVTSETFEGEVVIINLKSGSYYSLSGLGAEIWNVIEVGVPMDRIVDGATVAFGGDDTTRDAILGFLSRLRDEDLIVQEALPADPQETEVSFGGNGAVFTAPVLNKYTDMEQLLLLDPIHEVDEAGWPVTKPEPETSG